MRTSLLESRHGRCGAQFKGVPCSGGYTVPKDTESEKESFIEVLITGWKVDVSKVWQCLLGLERINQKVEGDSICCMAVLWDVVSVPVFTVTQQSHNSRLACLPEGDTGTF